MDQKSGGYLKRVIIVQDRYRWLVNMPPWLLPFSNVKMFTFFDGSYFPVSIVYLLLLWGTGHLLRF